MKEKKDYDCQKNEVVKFKINEAEIVQIARVKPSVM